MPLAREAVFNELNGAEVKAILEQRVRQVLDQVPYLQKHLTLPRVRMRVTCELNCWADQAGSETHHISDDFTVRCENAPSGAPDQVYSSEDVVDASPGPEREGHRPPSAWRDEHGLPDAYPMRGAVATEDVFLRPGENLPSQELPRLPEPEEPVRIPGLLVERGTHAGARDKTFMTLDRGGPSLTGPSPAPIEGLNFKNQGHSNPAPVVLNGKPIRDFKKG
jgi:hypothetical protein